MQLKEWIIKHRIILIIAVIFTVLLTWNFINSFSETVSDNAWDGVVANVFANGNGTEDNPYIISSASEYGHFKELLEGPDASLYLDKYYLITNSFNYGSYNISINNTLPFTGTIDGNGHSIYGAIANNSLFNELDGATIKNIKYGLSITDDKNSGILANSISNTKLSYFILEGNVNNSLEDIDISGIGININNSELDNIVINLDVDNSNYVSVSNNILDSEFNNILVRSGYNHSNGEIEVEEFILNDGRIVDINLDKYNGDDYRIVIEDNGFVVKANKMEESSNEEKEVPKREIPSKGLRSASITLHDSGIVAAEHAIYINDLVSDYDYYMGLNYTKITNTNGTIPTGVNQNLYSNSNLATVYIRYSSADINDSSMYGSVSVSEDIRNYYYYKRYPVVNGYITFDLIDNPWANRSTDMAFNGWVTDYDGATISLDMDTYVRSVKIPVSDISNPISITFYSSWTIASVVTTTTFTNLKSVGMNALTPSYGDLTIYYVTARVNNNSNYPTNAGTLYDLSGNRITGGSTCRTQGGCTYLRRNTNTTYNANTAYYSVTPNGNNPATVTRVYPQQKPIPYYDGGSAAGYFIRVTSGTENIYSSTGVKQDSCSGTCYKLLQYSDGNITSGTTYYYLTTRDTNIFAPTSTNNITANNISSTKPMTITGIHNGTDNSNNRTLRITDDWEITADIRIEFIRFYVSDTTTSVSEFDSDGYEIIGNFKNVKLGRGLKRNGSNLTANSFVGGSSSSATTLSKYTLIVESGFYQTGSAVGYGSAVTHRVFANVTLGSDYDRISSNGNSNLIVYYAYAGSWGSNLYNSSNSSNSYDTPAIYTVVKSGSFGTNKADYAAGIYVGGRSRGTHYSLREVLVEGGYIYNLIGGPSSDDGRASKNDIVINVKGGEIDLVFGGAGASDTVGNKILNITGGTINYSIVGGSNAAEYGTGTSNPNGKIDGDTLLYVGGNVTVGTKNDKLFTIASGDVYGAGNGRVGEPTIGAVNNSTVIIGPTATIRGSVYGGGNNGAVGGNTTGSATGGSGSTVTSGVYEDETTDNSIRYYGPNPDNYIQFNGELYRIVGLFNNVSTSSGSKNLVRIVKNASLGNIAWGDANMTTVATNTSTETTSGYFANNTYNYTNYYKNYYNFYVKNNNTKSNMYNYLNTTYYNGLNNTYKNYIEEVNWNLGATTNANQNTSTFYTAERSNGVVNYLTGINQTGNGNSAYSSSFKVGLFYPSDYGYANNDSSCLSSSLGSYSATCRTNNWMSGMTNAWTMTSSTDVTDVTRTYQVSQSGNWFNGYTYTMNRYYHVSNRNFVIGTGGLELKDIYYTGNDNDANNYYNTGAVYPSFYLKEDVTISGGSGKASDPYIIGSSNDTLIDIIDEIMHPSEPTEPPVITHDESEYMAKTHIEILGGSISGSVYGAGNKNGAGNNNNNRLALAKVTIDMTGGSVSESIYGGANAEGTVYGDVFINVIDGTVSGNVYGGGKGGPDNESDGTYVTDNVNVTIGSNATTNLHITGNVYGGSAFGTVNASDNTATESDYATNVTVNAGVITGSVFGGGEGDTNHTPYVIGNINVTINGGNITNVFGGNDQAGSHTKSNIVHLNGGTIGSVYGGGNKSSVTNTHVYLDGATVTNNIYGGSNTSGNVSATDVKIRSGSVGNVYGGNNEGGSCTTTNVLVEGTATISSSLYGGGNQVDTTTTNVSLNSAGATIPNVYGGGNSASVTTANITKGNVNVGNLFGGSNSSGTVGESHIICNGGTATNIYGGNNAGGSTIDTYIIFNGGSATTIYGGGNQASSDESNITINNGTIGTVFGGGNSAGLTESNIHMVTGNVTTIYGGSNTTGNVPTTNILIDNTASTLDSVYGGGNRATVGTTNITIANGTFGNIYGGGNLAQVNGNTLVDINGGTVNTNIYGGGNFGVVTGSSNVTITDATILGSAYAGGNGASAILQGNTNITIDGNTVVGSANSTPPTSGCVFGGGNQAATGIEANNNSTSHVNIVGGHIYGNVYGGANTSKIFGNTIVNIGQSAYTSTDLTKSAIHIHGHVFGGGEANASGSEIYDWSYISVTEGVSITIDADTYNNFLIDGSFYGGGNASSASGDSYLIIRNYGETGEPKDNISIQRVTYVTIDNSSILLRGAVDRANEYSNELFAISRVESLKLKNNSELYLVRGGNLLEEFESLDANGNIASVTIDTEHNTVTKTVDNRVYMYEGRNLNIAHDQQVTDYGEVHGMSFFGIFNFDNNGHVNSGIYSSEYDPGDTLPWEGTFGRGSYVLGAHVTNHNIKVNGFYSHFMNESTQANEVNYINPTPAAGRFYMWFVGENVIEYNVNLTASKYSTLGAVEVPFLDFSAPNTSFQIIGFDSTEIASGISLINKNSIPRIASNVNDADTKFGLAIEASNTGWLTTGRTTFYTREPGYEGVTYYEGENSDVAPTLLFYLYHSKNISIAQNLGTVRISVMAITRLNALSNQVRRLIINVNMSTILAQTLEYEGAMTPGDKYDLFTSTSTNITTKSKFSAYYSLYDAGHNIYQTGYHRALTSSYVFPEGTKITMLDFVNGTPQYYYHVITAADVTAAQTEYQLEGDCSYYLSMFTKMGSRSNNSNYNDATQNAVYYNGTDSNEEFIFIVDFSDTSINSNQLNNSLLLEMRDANDESIISVMGQQHAQLNYNLYYGLDSSIDISVTASLDPLYIGYNDIFETSISYSASTLSGVTITDTQYFDNKLGVRVYIKDGNDNVISGTNLTGAYFELNGVRYYPDISGYTHIKLADKVGNTKKWITFNTENANIATGDYTFMFEAFASPDGIYYSSGTPDQYDIDISIINTTYGLNPQISENSEIFSGTNNDKDLTLNIAYTSLLNNPNIRIMMYRRKYDTVYDTNYEEVDFQDYVNINLQSTSNENEYLLIDNPLANNAVTYDMKSTLLTGTYKLSFRLYDGNTQIGEVIRYIIIK